MKKTLALASVVLLAGSLTACGGSGGGSSSSSSGGYCDNVKNLQADFADFNFTQITDDDFSNLQNSLGDIQSSAPDDVADDWGNVSDALDQLKSILDEAGLSFDQLQQIQQDPNNLPDGVDLAKLQALGQKLNEFASNTDFQASADAIDANVKSECGIDLQNTGGSTTGS